MTSAVSVLLPFYNAGRWLDQALRCLEHQSGVDLEVVAIDDGSTDNSSDLVIGAIRRGLNARLIRNDGNKGIVHSLNAGIDHASHPYIARMDADDLCVPHRLEHQVQDLRRRGLDLCGSWFEEFGQGFPRAVRWAHSPDAVRAAMLFQNPICHPTVLAKREVFERYRYREDRNLAEDYDLFNRASADFVLANTPEVLLRYRRHPSQATQLRRSTMESVTRLIRGEALRQQGYTPTPQEEAIHNLIRAPRSITDVETLQAIEAWLLRLLESTSSPVAREIIASQWVRSCVRAAPLGSTMWAIYRRSPLQCQIPPSRATNADLRVLSMTKINYNSLPFRFARRLGLSA